jgi:hypothetical protein
VGHSSCRCKASAALSPSFPTAPARPESTCLGVLQHILAPGVKRSKESCTQLRHACMHLTCLRYCEYNILWNHLIKEVRDFLVGCCAFLCLIAGDPLCSVLRGSFLLQLQVVRRAVCSDVRRVPAPDWHRTNTGVLSP